MDWTNETVLRFLELYQMHPCIWDPRNASHKNKNRLNDAWIDIKHNLGEECTVKELKKKKESLMSAYRGYRAKIKKSETSGAGTPEIYQPTWFAYSLMDSFLGAIYKCTPSIGTEDGQNQQINTVGRQKQNSHGMLQRRSTNQGSSNSQKTSTTLKRRQYYPPELQETKKQMDQAFNILKTVSQQHEEEDESCIFGKLIAKKMRKLSEDRRDLMMVKINELFYNECHERHRPISSSMMSSTPSTSSRTEQDDIPHK